MATREQPAEPRINWTEGADRLVATAVEHAAKDGFSLDLRPDTPVIPDDRCRPTQQRRGTWGEIGSLFRDWTGLGCRWVNLRFSIGAAGEAVVRYEVQPEGRPLRPGRVTYANGGFDCRRLVTPEAFVRLHPDGPPDPI